MSTCLDIVRRALRLCAGQAGEPGGSEGDDAMERLQSIITGLPGMLFNANWRSRSVSTPYTARPGDRITASVAATITFPTTWSVNGCTQAIPDLARIQIVGGNLWLFSASKGVWGQADGLTLQSELPFGPEDDEGLACQLAVALVGEYGEDVSAATTEKARQSLASLRSRLKRASIRHDGDPCFTDYV